MFYAGPTMSAPTKESPFDLAKIKSVLAKQHDELSRLMQRTFVFAVVVGKDFREPYDENAEKSKADKDKINTWRIIYNRQLVEVVDNPTLEITVGCTVKCMLGDNNAPSIVELAEAQSFGKTSFVRAVIDDNQVENTKHIYDRQKNAFDYIWDVYDSYQILMKKKEKGEKILMLSTNILSEEKLLNTTEGKRGGETYIYQRDEFVRLLFFDSNDALMIRYGVTTHKTCLKQDTCLLCDENKKKNLTHYSELKDYKIVSEQELVSNICPLENCFVTIKNKGRKKTVLRDRCELEMAMFGVNYRLIDATSRKKILTKVLSVHGIILS